MQMTNLKVTLEPESTLFKEEVDVIVAVVVDTVDNLSAEGRDLSEGSFLLYGAADVEDESEKYEIQEIISFDFDNGPSAPYRPYSDGSDGITSRNFAEKILKRDLSHSHHGSAGHISYYVDSPLFMTLKTARGRFDSACFGEEFSYRDMTYIYCAVAQAFACMGKEDKVLQDSVDSVFFREAEEYKRIGDLRDHVEELFREKKLPEIKLWKDWHDKESGNLTLFFE